MVDVLEESGFYCESCFGGRGGDFRVSEWVG